MTAYLIAGEPVSPRADDPATVARALIRAAAIAPECGVGVIDDSGRELVTYPRFLERARRLLAGLNSSGIDSGDTVILQLSRIHDHLGAVWACLLGGIRPVVMTVPDTTDRAETHLEKLTEVSRILDDPPILADSAAAARFETRLGEARVLSHEKLARTETAAEVGDGDTTGPVMYLLSSGSTGRPKVIELTNRGLVELAIGARQQLGVDLGQTTFNWMPLDHSGAFLLYHVTEVYLAASNWHAPTGWVLRDPLRWLAGIVEVGADHS